MFQQITNNESLINCMAMCYFEENCTILAFDNSTCSLGSPLYIGTSQNKTTSHYVYGHYGNHLNVIFHLVTLYMQWWFNENNFIEFNENYLQFENNISRQRGSTHFVENHFVKNKSWSKNKWLITSSKLPMAFFFDGVQNPNVCRGTSEVLG